MLPRLFHCHEGVGSSASWSVPSRSSEISHKPTRTHRHCQSQDPTFLDQQSVGKTSACMNFEDYESDLLYVCPGFPKTLGCWTPSGRHARADVLKSPSWWTPSGRHGALMSSSPRTGGLLQGDMRALRSSSPWAGGLLQDDMRTLMTSSLRAGGLLQVDMRTLMTSSAWAGGLLQGDVCTPVSTRSSRCLCTRLHEHAPRAS